MKVKKIIELFESCNPKAIVRSHYSDGNVIAGIATIFGDDSIVCFVDESECNCNKMKTVEDIIVDLKQLNPNAEVKIHTLNGELVLFVVAYTHDNNNVWLETESDNDMYSEISARFEDAVETGADELDVYMEMLEIGIDVDMVRRWMGDEDADHMKAFCEEHGLI